MISTNQTLSSVGILSKEYIETRKDLLTILRLVNSRLDFNSQTFFLAVCYMDEIFSKRLSLTVLKDYILIALSCLLIASKFSENDPNVPELRKYLSAIANATKYRFTFTINDLRYGELVVLRYLDYRLNYYSIYHFISFFFAHGIILSDSGKIIPIEDKNATFVSMNNDFGNKNAPSLSLSFSISNKQLLEKVYILSRELLDFIIEEEAFFVTGKENAIAAIEILKKSIESLIRIDINNEDVFDSIYKMNEYLDSNLNCNSIKQIVNTVYEIKVLKKRESINLRIEPVTNKDIEMIDSSNKDNHYLNLNQRSRFHLNLNEIKASFSNNYERQIHDLTNHRDYSNNFTIRKRPCSSSKDHIMKGIEDLDSKNTLLCNLNEHHYNANSNNNPEVFIKHPNTHINPVYQKFTKRPPVKSIRIKKELISNKNNSLANSSTNATHMVNSQSNTIISPTSLKHQQEDDILDKTKKIIENSNKAKNETQEKHYADCNNIIEENMFNEPMNPSQIKNEFVMPTYNTIIINNNININAFVPKNNKYDTKKKWTDIDMFYRKNNNITNPTSNHTTNNNLMMNYRHINSYHNPLLNNSKETDLIHRPNYFGTHFDYGSDLWINKYPSHFDKNIFDSRIKEY